MASKGINKVILVGNLGQDPDVRYTPSGKAVANLSIATSESWKDQQGQMQERTEWHRVVIWGKTAEVAGEYLKKGSQVYIEGKLQTRKWQDQQGQDKYTTEVVVQGWDDKMQMLGGGGRGGDNQGGGFNPQQGRPQNQGYQQYPGNQQSGGQQNAPQNAPQNSPQNKGQNQPQPISEPDFDFDDDIPFFDRLSRQLWRVC